MVLTTHHTFTLRSQEPEDRDFLLYTNQHQGPYASDLYGISGSADFNMPSPYMYPRTMDEAFTTAAAGFTSGNSYAEAPQLFVNGTHSPGHYNSPELQPPPSVLSTTPGQSASASSSIIGSPYSTHTYGVPVPEWGGSSNQGLAIGPSIVGYDSYGNDYNASGMEQDFVLDEYTKPGFVDPSLIHTYPQPVPTIPAQGEIPGYHSTSMYQPPVSPSPSHMSSRDSRGARPGSQSPYLHGHQYGAYPYPSGRRPSPSTQSYGSPSSVFSDDSAEKGRCTYPECGKVFKDLKAHMLTHQTERPEKCPIATCDYHTKGFARKYDKNRHTLTHYKGTMVCGFCPGSGSAAEKSFNRADVFKRHLTSVHAVEQSPPNSRKKAPTSAGQLTGKKLAGYPSDATGKCSTCSVTFNNAQDFYEHLDDCVLRIVQQEDPSEAINARRLAEVERDPQVIETLRNHALPTSTPQTFESQDEDDEDNDNDDADDDEFMLRSTARGPRSRSALGRGNTSRPSAATLSGGIQKSRGLTHSKGGVTLHTKSGRKKRKDYPTSWGCAAPQMRMKKRVMCVFDGPRRLWKDDMMVDSDYEVRVKLAGIGAGLTGNEYITDLDLQTMKRAEAFHNATPEEKGEDVSDDLSADDLTELMRIKDEV